jgi:hypothetical protein
VCTCCWEVLWRAGVQGPAQLAVSPRQQADNSACPHTMIRFMPVGMVSPGSTGSASKHAACTAALSACSPDAVTSTHQLLLVFVLTKLHTASPLSLNGTNHLCPEQAQSLAAATARAAAAVAVRGTRCVAHTAHALAARRSCQTSPC